MNNAIRGLSLAWLVALLPAHAQSPIGFRIRAERELVISSEVAGRVILRSDLRSKTVEKGAVLLRIDPTFFRIEREKAQALVRAAEATIKLAQQDLKRTRELVEKGSGLPAELDRREADLALAEASFAQRRAELHAAEERLERTVIRAPIAGHLSDLLPEAGEWVPAHAPVAELHSIDRLVAEAFVDPATLRALPEDGQLELVTQEATPRRLHARVIERTLASRRDRLRLVLEIKDAPADLIPGTRAVAQIPGAKR